MAYQLPQVKIIDFKQDNDSICSIIKFENIPSSPIAPATIHGINDPSKKFTLHKLISREGNILTFMTYKADEIPFLKGDTCSFSSYWRPDQLELVRDQSINWSQMEFTSRYPETHDLYHFDHEHCELCFRRISQAEDDDNTGYTNGKIWICNDCYHYYIESKFGLMLGLMSSGHR